ncbi:MAG: hypothetical protein AAGI03_11770 [Pseudomonadota bacterium]
MTALVRTTDTATSAPFGVVARDAQTRFLTEGRLTSTTAPEAKCEEHSRSLLVTRRTRQRRRMARS